MKSDSIPSSEDAVGIARPTVGRHAGGPQVYVCVKPITLTDSFKIQDCQAIRTIKVGEILEPLEHPVVTRARARSGEELANFGADKAVTRLPFRCQRDGKEGWVTIKYEEDGRKLVFVEPTVLVSKQDADASRPSTD